MKRADYDNPERDYKGLINAAVTAMTIKLLENSHKEGFDTMEMWELESKLIEERTEVDAERDSLIEADTPAEQIEVWTRLIRECADEMNVLAMIILRGNRMIKILESRQRAKEN